MRLRLKHATVNDILEIVNLWQSVNNQLASRLGRPHWTKFLTPQGVYLQMRKATMYVVREGSVLVAVFTLSMQKPWDMNEIKFNPAARPLYLTDLAIHPFRHQCGIELLCIREAIKIARRWPSDAIRLDSCDLEFGREVRLEEFGFRTVGTTRFREIPSVHFELPI
jgi:hypothetical protein